MDAEADRRSVHCTVLQVTVTVVQLEQLDPLLSAFRRREDDVLVCEDIFQRLQSVFFSLQYNYDS